MGLAFVGACQPEKRPRDWCETAEDCDSDDYFKCVDNRCVPDHSIGRELTLDFVNEVDILVVIDDGPSSAASQDKLVRALDVLVERLERHDPPVDYRIAFTSTDAPRFTCPGVADAAGTLRLSPCTAREDSFGDAFAERCLAGCPQEVAEAFEPRPMVSEADVEPIVRPWLERRAGRYNFEGVTMAQAVRCVAPQGIDGCRLGQPLEAMHGALTARDEESAAGFGLVRAGSVTAVLIVTDEVDCSTNPALESAVFDPSLPVEDKVFWSDPTSSTPTPAICWNAGVDCETVPGGAGLACWSRDHAVDGSMGPQDPETDAIQRPLSRYREVLEALDHMKSEEGLSDGLVVSVIAGVPEGHTESFLPPLAAAGEPALDAEYGIGFGCIDDEGRGSMPPVRVVDLLSSSEIEGTTPTTLHSICAPDFDDAVLNVANAIEARLQPGCFEKCAADTTPETPAEVSVDCALSEENGATGDKREVPRCDGRSLPDGRHVCWFARTGTVLAPGGERMDPECEAFGWNLEIVIVRDPDEHVPAHTSVATTCAVSDAPEIDCPNL